MIDEFHKHELLDRIHCLNEMFDSLILNHPAAVLMQKELEKAAESLGKLYQKAGMIRHEL
ncbi:hypothetical protein [Herbaspirillum sp. ST 5-3]|uniref:hypothetical protein n=1 Tax=Oxalobacteraceae TaxID=75682 RepID=UPI0010A580D2|nr:hypothetical protein [Herbaspirillum sp. ST 5-3]